MVTLSHFFEKKRKGKKAKNNDQIHSRENREQSLNFECFPCSISTTEPVLRVKNSQ